MSETIWEGYGLRIGRVPGRVSVALEVGGEPLAYFRSEEAARRAAVRLPVPGLGEPEEEEAEAVDWYGLSVDQFRGYYDRLIMPWGTRGTDAPGNREHVLHPLLVEWGQSSIYVPVMADDETAVEYALERYQLLNENGQRVVLWEIHGSLRSHGLQGDMIDNTLGRRPGDPFYGRPYDARRFALFCDKLLARSAG